MRESRINGDTRMCVTHVEHIIIFNIARLGRFCSNGCVWLLAALLPLVLSFCFPSSCRCHFLDRKTRNSMREMEKRRPYTNDNTPESSAPQSRWSKWLTKYGNNRVSASETNDTRCIPFFAFLFSYVIALAFNVALLTVVKFHFENQKTPNWNVLVNLRFISPALPPSILNCFSAK